MIRTMKTEAFNHDPGVLMLTTGHTQFGRPSLGAWVAYGLGSESQNLPGFVVLGSGQGPNGGSNIWGNGFLPSVYQGTRFRSTGDPILYLSNPEGVSRELQRARLDALKKLNESALRKPVISRSPLGSIPTSWRFGCKWPRPTCSIFRGNRSKLSILTVSRKSRPGSMASIVYWRGEWSSAACGS